jgi:hypothetical protein
LFIPESDILGQARDVAVRGERGASLDAGFSGYLWKESKEGVELSSTDCPAAVY